MQRYAEYQPTTFDRKGIALPDQQDWLVLPVMQTRDSGPLDESNFAVALDSVGGEDSDDVEVHRFGHWGPGWFEIIIVRPESQAAKEAEEIESALADYPILSEDDHSRREYERAGEYWDQCSLSDRIEWCARFDVSIFAARRNEIPEDPRGELIMRLAE